MGGAKFFWSLAKVEGTLMTSDPSFAGSRANVFTMTASCGISKATGSFVGTALAAFAAPNVAVTCTFISSVLNLLAVLSITERD